MLSERDAAIADIRVRLDSGAPVEAVIAQLKEDGWSLHDAMVIVRNARGVSLQDAQDLLWESRLWADDFDVQDSLRELFMEGWEAKDA